MTQVRLPEPDLARHREKRPTPKPLPVEGHENLDEPEIGLVEPEQVRAMPQGPHASDAAALDWVYDHLEVKDLDISRCPGQRAYQLLLLARRERLVRNRVVQRVIDRRETAEDRRKREKGEADVVTAADKRAIKDEWRAEAEAICKKLESYEAMMMTWDPHGNTLRLLDEIRKAKQED